MGIKEGGWDEKAEVRYDDSEKRVRQSSQWCRALSDHVESNLRSIDLLRIRLLPTVGVGETMTGKEGEHQLQHNKTLLCTSGKEFSWRKGFGRKGKVQTLYWREKTIFPSSPEENLYFLGVERKDSQNTNYYSSSRSNELIRIPRIRIYY